MFFDVLFMNTSTGILQYHHRINTFFTDSRMQPHSLCMILRSITQASMEVLQQSLLYMELSSAAISIHNSQSITCIVIHEIFDKDCYGSVISEALVSLYKNVIQNAFTRSQQMNQLAAQSYINSKLLEYMRLALTIALDKLCFMKYTASCYITILNHPYSTVFQPGIITGKVRHLPPKTQLLGGTGSLETKVDALIDAINDTLEAVFASTYNENAGNSPEMGERCNLRLSTFEMYFDTIFKVRITSIFPGAYLVLVQNKRVKQHSFLHQDNATMSIVTQESMLESSAQVSTLTVTPTHTKSTSTRFEKNKFMVCQLTHAIIRLFDSAHQLKQRTVVQ